MSDSAAPPPVPVPSPQPDQAKGKRNRSKNARGSSSSGSSGARGKGKGRREGKKKGSQAAKAGSTGDDTTANGTKGSQSDKDQPQSSQRRNPRNKNRRAGAGQVWWCLQPPLTGHSRTAVHAKVAKHRTRDHLGMVCTMLFTLKLILRADDPKAGLIRGHLRLFSNPEAPLNKRLNAGNSLQSTILSFENHEVGQQRVHVAYCPVL